MLCFDLIRVRGKGELICKVSKSIERRRCTFLYIFAYLPFCWSMDEISNFNSKKIHLKCHNAYLINSQVKILKNALSLGTCILVEICLIII